MFERIKETLGFKNDTIVIEDYLKTPRDGFYWQALRSNRLRTFKDVLLHKKLDVNDYVIDKIDHTLLHQSIILNKQELFQLSLDFHADIEKTDNIGMTPLIRAVSLGRTKMVQILINKGANPYQIFRGQDAFQRAEFYEREDIYDILQNSKYSNQDQKEN